MIGTELKAQANWEVGMRFGHNIAIDATIPIGLSPRLHPAVYITDRWGVGAYFDWRPGFKVTENFKGKASNWGFTARFRIGEGKFVKAN